MTDIDKIKLMDSILKLIKESSTTEDMPVMVGHLNKKQGQVGFKPAEIGHPVFEFNDRYLIYLESNTGDFTTPLKYYKETLSPVIDFI